TRNTYRVGRGFARSCDLLPLGGRSAKFGAGRWPSPGRGVALCTHRRFVVADGPQQEETPPMETIPSSIHVFLANPAPEAPAEAPGYGFFDSIVNAGLSEQLVMLILFGMSIASWAVIAYKWRTLRRATYESESFLDSFWASKRLDAIFQKSEA